YLDLGGTENLAVNGSAVFVGDIAAAPPAIGGVAVSVTAGPVPGGTRGTVVLTGNITSLRIGGQELWIDNICAIGEAAEQTDGAKTDPEDLVRPTALLAV